MDKFEQITKRQECNREILKILGIMVENLPQMRFGQILANFVFPDYQERDIFYKESYETLQHLKKTVDYEEEDSSEKDS